MNAGIPAFRRFLCPKLGAIMNEPLAMSTNVKDNKKLARNFVKERLKAESVQIMAEESE